MKKFKQLHNDSIFQKLSIYDKTSGFLYLSGIINSIFYDVKNLLKNGF